MNILEIEKLFQLMNRYGITNFKSGEVEIQLPSPKKTLAQKLSTISVEEIKAIQKQDDQTVKDTLIQKRMNQDEIDDHLLFAHEQF